MDKLFPRASIFKKITMMSAAVLLITAVIVNVSVVSIKRSMEEELTSFGNKMLEFYTDGLDSQIRVLEDYSFTMMQLSDFQEPLKGIAGLDNRQDPLGASISLSAAIRSDPINISAVKGLLIADVKGAIYAGATGRYERLISDNVLRQAAGGGGGPVWVSLPEASGHIALCRTIRTVRNDFQYWDLGTLVLVIDLEQLTNSESLQTNFYESGLTIANTSGQILYTGEGGAAVGGLLEEEAFRTEESLLLTRQARSAGWMLYLTIPKKHIYFNINTIVNTQHALFVLLFLLAISSSVFFASRITSPLRRLQQEMRKVSGGDFNIDKAYLLGKTGNDEIGQICQSFAVTTQQLETLINENYKAQIDQKDAQIRALQAQINPHFIYNTLDTVNWLAKMNRQETIASTVQALSHLLRSAMSTHTTKATLREELALVKDYIKIQQLRFGQRLIYKETVDERTLQVRLPCLILQPIVENAIKHCVEKTDQCCEVNLWVQAGPDASVQIIIADDGPGIAGLAGATGPSGLGPPQNNGIGLQNVQRRLSLMYGQRAAFTLRNVVPHGLEARIVIRENEEGMLGEKDCFGG